MKKLNSLLILSSFLLLCLSANAQNVNSKKQSKFVSKFVGAVNVQKENKVFRMVAREYTANFDNSKEETLSNLFAGRFTNTGEFSKIPFNKIYNIRIKEVFELQDEIILYKFILTTVEGPVETQLYLKSDGKKGKLSFHPVKN